MEHSTRLDPSLFGRRDYYVAALKRVGIYHTWSHIFEHKPAPRYRDRLLAYEEIQQLGGNDFQADHTRLFAVRDELDFGYHYTVLADKGHQLRDMWEEVCPEFVRVMANACVPPLD